MTEMEASKLPNGLYRLYWHDGSSSLASVGHNASAYPWYAPANWLSVPGYNWAGIRRVERINHEEPESSETEVIITTMKSAAELFLEASSRCPHKHGTPEYSRWVHDEIKRVEALICELRLINNLAAQEDERHRKEKRKLAVRLYEARKKCHHEMTRSTAECNPVCTLCGWEDDMEPLGYDG